MMELTLFLSASVCLVITASLKLVILGLASWGGGWGLGSSGSGLIILGGSSGSEAEDELEDEVTEPVSECFLSCVTGTESWISSVLLTATSSSSASLLAYPASSEDEECSLPSWTGSRPSAFLAPSSSLSDSWSDDSEDEDEDLLDSC